MNGNRLNAAQRCTWSGLARRYGDPASDRVFNPDDYKMYLFNEFLAREMQKRAETD